MKIQILSDLHLEFFGKWIEIHEFLNSLLPNKDDRDVLAIAGDLGLHAQKPMDIGTLLSALVFFSRNYKKVIYVLGNHEYYFSNFIETNKILNHLEDTVNNIIGEEKLYILNKKSIKHNNFNISGATLWFNEKPENFYLTKWLNDFQYIREDLFSFHNESKADLNYLKNNVDMGLVQIIISHHLPSRKSLERETPIDIYYVNDDATKLLSNINSPKLWIHGHTHNSLDYSLGDTRIVCNPFGYFNRRQNSEFKPNLVVEL